MRPPPSSPVLQLADLVPDRSGIHWSSIGGARRVHLTYSGTAAIYQYLAWLRRSGPSPGQRDVVLVPAFHCPNVVDPILHAGYEPRFFGVDEHLRVDAGDFLSKLDRRVAAAVFIMYFGFPEIQPALVSACRDAGAKIIEDCSHSFLFADPLRLAVFPGVDAATFSFWKLVPGKAGGGLAVEPGVADGLKLDLHRAPIRDSWRRLRLLVGQAWEERKAERVHREPRDAARSFSAASPASAGPSTAAEAYPYRKDLSCARMPLLSRLALEAADLNLIVDVRRENYRVYAECLHGSDELQLVRPELPSHVVPWAFPVILRQRSQRDYQIRARGVALFTFGEVLHPALAARHRGESAMLDRARFLSENLLALSVHQGIDRAHIERSSQVLNAFMSGT